ncbi:MAG: OmpH family outer membrane protein [Pseudodesulfovibrio sp.]|uniref:Outer membrane chaperone Skp (OmpH) n=1 Tax=Pseudodesulfovibrio aespoeensis (strain ATCC 700646 / DSM 10631 / Aspo-2) TaxID=643562 RepID=E6VWH4_PSEA9|nr:MULTISPECIES: OmpH family outer membrane protein [Pseudodesulfovibrio]MBU4191717.1 OmpH family outer membrane protein [Pseudomonadota bacterium]ADU61380.1 outer membrane chaperone Skp (OmpH) [Pseudodesulfovibrio aespoeensis Aspo-2]MBU4242972.1 OmpH family outer membrane protein [Pseudomonadota bacterium]MBU4378612.1 OmpH family outer membrane protein [Pseudomonadota bacterium]MBU4474773.1 OmpH family outer membrane protein [Pseudomonadota bacterium]
MKRVILLLCVALLGFTILTGCNQQQAGVAIGVVDEAAAFKDNKAAAAAMAYLQELGVPLQKKAEEAYKAMQEEQNETTVNAYKAAMGDLQSIMNEEQQRVVALIDAKFNEVLDTYRKEKGLTLILSKQSVIASDDTVDITADITAAMDKVELDLTPPAKPEAPAEAAPAAQAETPAEETKPEEAPATEAPATETPAEAAPAQGEAAPAPAEGQAQ